MSRNGRGRLTLFKVTNLLKYNSSQEQEDPNESDVEPNEDSSRVQTSASENSVVLVDSNTSSANNTTNLNTSEPTEPQNQEEVTTNTTALVTSPITTSAVKSFTSNRSSPEIIPKNPINTSLEKFLHPCDIQKKLNGITADIGQMSINQTLSSSGSTSTPTKVSCLCKHEL